MISKPKLPRVYPGELCQPDARNALVPAPHVVLSVADDTELQSVHRWLMDRPLADLLRYAADSAVKYVLDGARTWRFDLLDPAVDSDERATVGTKLQYHIIQQLGLTKAPPLDTTIAGIAVEIKGTVRTTWMIPREGQCQVTMLVRIHAKGQRFAVWLMRTHRVWLTSGDGNGDKKRSPLARDFSDFAIPLVPWTALPPEPLRDLSRAELDVVFGNGGLRSRLVALFSFLPEVVIPRGSIAVVGAGLHDPMKRAREAKVELRELHGLVVLVGTWTEEREAAERIGFDISEESWVSIPLAKFAALGIPVPAPR